MSLTNRREGEEISGNTLKVYYYLLLKRQSCGVREIQRALGFSSSSTAHYHLEKLTGKGVLKRDAYGNYKINQDAKLAMISSFVIIRGFMFPRQLVYAVATSIMCILFVTFFWNTLTLTVILALCPGVLASGIFWYDAVKMWRSLPSFEKSVRES